MGFNDTSTIIEAIQTTNGNLESAVERLLNQM